MGRPVRIWMPVTIPYCRFFESADPIENGHHFGDSIVEFSGPDRPQFAIRQAKDLVKDLHKPLD
jgi:hypothetical protein